MTFGTNHVWAYHSNNCKRTIDPNVFVCLCWCLSCRLVDGDAERKRCCGLSAETQNRGASGEPEQHDVLLQTRSRLFSHTLHMKNISVPRCSYEVRVDEHLSVRVSHVCFREAHRISDWAAAAAEGVSAERRHRTKSVQQRQPGHDLRDSGPHQSEIYYICPIQTRWEFDTTLTTAWKASNNNPEPITSTHIFYNMPFIHFRIFNVRSWTLNVFPHSSPHTGNKRDKRVSRWCERGQNITRDF